MLIGAQAVMTWIPVNGSQRGAIEPIVASRQKQFGEKVTGSEPVAIGNLTDGRIDSHLAMQKRRLPTELHQAGLR
jgi:hypothetical protein